MYNHEEWHVIYLLWFQKLSMKMDAQEVREKKKKILCLHGFRNSGSYFRKQISKWDPSVFQHLELDFPDAMFPAGGKSDLEGVFPPPYFEWFQYNKEFTEYKNLEECISYLCDYMMKNGPFHGLLGFSQGATLSGLLAGYQAQGRILKDHRPVEFVISIAGTKFRDTSICDVAYKDVLKVKSVHLIGEKDALKVPAEELAYAFDNPLILRHPRGHTVPRLDEEAVERLSEWTASIAGSNVISSIPEPSEVDCEMKVKQEAVVDSSIAGSNVISSIPEPSDVDCEMKVKQEAVVDSSIAGSNVISSIPEPSDVDCEMKVKQETVVDSKVIEASTAA